MEDSVFTTPMMKQYQEIKKKYPDCLLFFRLGDFYELFLDDALIGSKVLDITLTGRPRGKDGRIPMAGVPFHAVDAYLSKLVKAGYKVAICEQVTEPDKYGIVEREVIRVVTPGTVLDEKSLNSNENNYIIALAIESKTLGIACADISTGEFKASELGYTDLYKTVADELTSLAPSECIVAKKAYDNPLLLKVLNVQPNLNVFCYQAWDKAASIAEKYLRKELKLKSLYSTGLESKPVAQQASAALYAYLKETQKDKLFHITSITELNANSYMKLDRATILNLELFSPIREATKLGTLISVLDKTFTAGGARMLKKWIASPLIDLDRIRDRHNAVEELIASFELTEKITENLGKIPDIERIVSRISVGIGNARDLISLKNALINCIDIAKSTSQCKSSLLSKLLNSITEEQKVESLVTLIENKILEEPAFDPKDGGIIKPYVNNDLDELRSKSSAGKDWVAQLELEERERTKISSLKVRFNKVFGFYIEVSNSNLAAVPAHYTRKQTLVNGERYITPELKLQEELILSAEEKSKEIEYQIYTEVLDEVIKNIASIQKASRVISELDCLISFTKVALDNRYIRPNFKSDGSITLKDARHPVVEKLLDESSFVPNNLNLNHEREQLLLITGPNMAGKSVYMRQIALIVLMAHIGSYVPASHADISPVDRIFVRSGASDMITSGLSTFMVEMVETAYILHHATANSLIVMDEIGRGTSTYDGISIAWAIAEYLVTNKKLQTKTLFATHYHELQKLQEKYPDKIKNYHMAIHEENGQPVFLHTIREGGAAHSFGVAVAKLAGIPQQVIENAQKMLHELETRALQHQDVTSSNISKIDKEQLTFSFTNQENTLVQELEELDIHQMTPLQALNKLAEIKNKIKMMHYSTRDFHKAD